MTTGRLQTLLQDPIARAIGLALLCLVLFLPGQTSIPPIDRDEARFVQATRQMVESGDYLDIRFQDEARHKKPIGIYWLQVLAVKASGLKDAIWPYRAVSWMSMLASVVLTGALAGRLFGPAAGGLAGLLLATALLPGVEARMAKTDSALLLTILLAQFVLARAYLDGALARWEAAVFWLALGAGTLIKGPIILLVTGLTILTLVALERRGTWLRALQPLPGFGLYLLVVLPWLVAITLRTGGAFWSEAVGHDLLAKAAGVQESHGGFPGYYLATFFLTFWPWAPLLLPLGVYVWKARGQRAVLFCLAWIVPFWLLFELLPTKLMHYTLPAFPPLAMLMAAMLVRWGRRPPGWAGTAVLMLCLVLVVMLAGGIPFVRTALGRALEPDISFFALLGHYPPSFAVLGAALVLGGCIFLAWQRELDRKPHAALALLGLGLTVFYGTVYGRMFSRLDDIWVSRQAAALIVPQRAVCNGPVISTDYAEPSLVFLAGRALRFLPAEEVLPAVQTWHCSLVLLGPPSEAKLLPAFATAGLEVVPVGTVKGFNYARGKAQTLTLYSLTQKVPS